MTAGGVEGRRGAIEGVFLSVFLSLYVQPSVLFCSQTLSVNLVSTAKNPVRITNEDYWTGSCGFPRGVRACLSVFMYVWKLCVCVTCLWNKNVLVCPQTDIWPCPIGHRGLQTSSLCLFTLAHSAPLPLANDPGGHIHSFRQEAHPGYFPCIQHFNSEKKNTKALIKFNMHCLLVFHCFKS